MKLKRYYSILKKDEFLTHWNDPSCCDWEILNANNLWNLEEVEYVAGLELSLGNTRKEAFRSLKNIINILSLNSILFCVRTNVEPVSKVRSFLGISGQKNKMGNDKIIESEIYIDKYKSFMVGVSDFDSITESIEEYYLFDFSRSFFLSKSEDKHSLIQYLSKNEVFDNESCGFNYIRIILEQVIKHNRVIIRLYGDDPELDFVCQIIGSKKNIDCFFTMLDF